MSKPGSLKKAVTPDQLRALYADHTDSEIAAMYGVSDVAVSKARRDWGIPTKNFRQRRDEGKAGPSLDDLTPEVLAHLYELKSDRQIGEMYGVSKLAIRKRREAWGIKTISQTERATVTDPLTEEQKQVVIGTLLGDGHMLRRGVLKVAHAMHQLGYLKWLHGILQPFSRPIKFSQSLKNGKVYQGCAFQTVQHEWFKEMRQVFYPGDGKRIFPDVLMVNLSPLSLAVWYFDDGSLGDPPYFALGDISEEEAERVCVLVAQRFKIDVYLRPHSRTKTCKIMGLRSASKDAFFSLISEFATPDMLYKLPPAHRPVNPSSTTSPVVERSRATLCGGCGTWFEAKNSARKFCSDTCYARYRRRRHRIENPPKTTRTFTCRTCGHKWDCDKPGGCYLYCDSCREQKRVRTKTCGYRNCRIEFLDESPHSSMSYCCPEHRRREKVLRRNPAATFKTPG